MASTRKQNVEPSINSSESRLELHLIRAHPEPAGTHPPLAIEQLSDTERTRFLRYRHPVAQTEFLAGRWLARSAIARWLEVSPSRIDFVIGDLGQPVLAVSEAPPLATRLNFSLSHSHGLVLCALALDRRLGVDVEPLTRAGSLCRILRRFLTVAELGELASLPTGGRSRWLLERWLDKEAFGKARGLGIQIHFDHIFASPAGDGLVCFDSDDGSIPAQQVHHWYLDPLPGFMAALICDCIDRPSPTLVIHDHGSLWESAQSATSR